MVIHSRITLDFGIDDIVSWTTASGPRRRSTNSKLQLSLLQLLDRAETRVSRAIPSAHADNRFVKFVDGPDMRASSRGRLTLFLKLSRRRSAARKAIVFSTVAVPRTQWFA